MAHRRWCAAAVLVAVQLAWLRPVAAQDATSGALQGQVRELGTTETLVGVLVSIRGSGREQTTMTDDDGSFRLTDLTPGRYEVLFHYAGVTLRYTGVQIALNHTTALYPKLDLSKAGVVYELDGRAPIIDPTTMRLGPHIGHGLLEKGLFPGTDVGSVFGIAPGTSQDGAGITFSGSSSPESRINIDGLDTTGIKYGTLGSSLLTDFVEEIDIATGGYGAEHGRSTGAVVSVVTKTGTNELRGSVFTRFTPGFLVAPRDRTPSQSSSIDADSALAFEGDLGFELGGPISKDRLWFYVGLAPRHSRTNIDRVTKRQTDCRERTADGGLTECDPERYADGVPDQDPDSGFLLFEELDRQRLHATSTRLPFLAKLNWAPRSEHQGQLSLIGTPGSTTSVGVRGTPAATRFEIETLTTDLAAKWTSKLDDNRTEISAVIGWHRVATTGGSVDASMNDVPREVLTGVGLDQLHMLGYESAATAAGCADGAGDPYPLIENCPNELGYAIGGPGALLDETAERLAAKLDAVRRIQAPGGNHELKAGIDVEDNRLDHVRGLSGGVSYETFGDSIYAQRWVEIAPPGAGGFADRCVHGGLEAEVLDCRFVDRQRVRGQTLNWAAYLRDSWQPMPNLTFNAGLRYEEQRLRYARDIQNTEDPFTGTRRGKNALLLAGMWSPRLGVAYDWTREGKSRAFAHWGRFYESIPMDINDRSFGGETLYRATYQAGDCESGPLGPRGSGCDPAAASEGFVFGGGVLVAPGVRAQYMDEHLVGLEYELTDDLKIGASYQHRRLGRVLEDLSVDNAETYILANPGEWSADDERALEQRIAGTDDPDEVAQLEAQLAQFRRIRQFDRPRRDYQAIELTATRRFSRKMFLQASYTYSRNQGNYPGLLSSDNGQLDPNISSQFDLIELLANRDGPLPLDRPHYIKLDGYYTFDLSRFDQLTTVVRARALSGTPVSALARHYLYGPNESFLLPRGAMGRTDFDYGLDVRLGYTRKLAGGMELSLYADVFNLLDRQGTFQVSQTYTLDNANPIVGGSYQDLVFAKQLGSAGGETAEPLSRHRNFRNPTVRYAPLSARFGARLTF